MPRTRKKWCYSTTGTPQICYGTVLLILSTVLTTIIFVSLKGLAQAKIIKKLLILFWLPEIPDL